MQKEFEIIVGLGVARHDPPAAVRSRDADNDHLDRSEFFQHGQRCQTGSISRQAILQRHLQTVSQKRDEDMCVDAMLLLMVDRTMPNSLFKQRNTASICVSMT